MKEVIHMANEALNAKIREKFKTDAAFGFAMGWVPQKVSKMTKGNYVPKFDEAARMSRVLDVSLDELASFFAQ